MHSSFSGQRTVSPVVRRSHPSALHAHKLVQASGLDPDDADLDLDANVEVDEGDVDIANAASTEAKKSRQSAPLRGRSVPLIDVGELARLAASTGAIDGDSVVATNSIISHFDCGRRAFGLVIGDLRNVRSFLPGDIVIIDPDKPALPGSMILARHANRAILGRLRVDAEMRSTMLAEHPDWPPVTLEHVGAPRGDSQEPPGLIGVVTEHSSEHGQSRARPL